jgi:hypothetical protein
MMGLTPRRLRAKERRRGMRVLCAAVNAEVVLFDAAATRRSRR